MQGQKSAIYNEFAEIEVNDYYRIINYYRRHSDEISLLDEIEYHYLQYRYIQALFETGAYDAVLFEVDELIEYTFLEGVEFEVSKTFETLLYYKARSLRNVMRYDEAQTLSEQLLAIEPRNKRYARLLQSIVKEKMSDGDNAMRLLAIIFIFSAIIISASYWLITLSTNKEPKGYISLIILTSPCILAMVVLGISYARAEITAYILIKKIISQAAKKSQAIS